MELFLDSKSIPSRAELVKFTENDRAPSLRCLCGRLIHYSLFSYCPYCGQRLDWSRDKRKRGNFI